MLDIIKHKFYLVTLLKDIYSDTMLATNLGFKGGTAHMLFYGLPRFSIDLDFNLLDTSMNGKVYENIREITLKHGSIRDEAKKHHGLLLVLDYGENERNLKIEISNRIFPDKYEVKSYLGIPIKIMLKSDMFSHKLCALLDRSSLASRDIFDIYYFMKEKTPVNKAIIEKRIGKDYNSYMTECITRIEGLPKARLLDGIGELVSPELKKFVRVKLKDEILQLLKIYKEIPIFSNDH